MTHEQSFGKDARVKAIVPTVYGAVILGFNGLAYLANDGKAKRLTIRGKGQLSDACVTPRGTMIVVGSGAKWSAEIYRSEDFARVSAVPISDHWVTTFNHVRPHEALGMKTPGEIYRASPRRPGRTIIGGYPDGCRLMDVAKNNGSINVDGWKIYLSHAFSGYAVGLQGYECGYRVWFFHVLLGTFIPGTHETSQPAVVEEL